MQCILPQRPTDQTRWRTSHGRASLSVEAGSLANPARPNEWLDCAVPSGPKPRLIIPYIVGEAVRNNSPEVDLDIWKMHAHDTWVAYEHRWAALLNGSYSETRSRSETH